MCVCVCACAQQTFVHLIPRRCDVQCAVFVKVFLFRSFCIVKTVNVDWHIDDDDIQWTEEKIASIIN